MEKFQNILGVQSYDESNRVFLCSEPKTGELSAAKIWSADPLTGINQSSLNAIISSFSCNLNPGSFIQLSVLSSNEITPFLNEYERRKINADGILHEFTNRNIEMLKNAIDEPLVKASQVKIHTKTLIITIKEPIKLFDDFFIKQFAEKADRFATSLNSASIVLNCLNETGYLSLARKLTHIYDPVDDRYDEKRTIADQVFYDTDHVEFEKNKIWFKTGNSPDTDFFAAALSVKQLPSSAHIGLMNHLIGDPLGINNQITNPYFINATIHYPDQSAKKTVMDRRSQWINKQAYGPMGQIPKVRARKEGLDIIMNELVTGSTMLVDFNLTFWIFSKDEQELASCADSTRTHWASLGLESKQDSFILDALWATTFPLNSTMIASSKLSRFKTLTLKEACQFLPIFGDHVGTKSPAVTLVTRRGEIAGFDLFQSNGNYNAVVAAASGSGKSFFMQRLITDYLAEGAQVWVIDRGHSYKKLSKSLGERSTYLELDPLKPQNLNPFSSFLDGRLLDDNLDSIITIFEKMISNRDKLNDLEIEKLKGAIRSVFNETQGFSTVDGVYRYLSMQPDDMSKNLATRLQSYAEGQHSKWFNNSTGSQDVSLDNDFVVLELDNLKEEQFRNVITTTLMNAVGDAIFRSKDKRRKKIFIIDEAWAFMSDPTMVNSMELCFRTARKYEASAIVVTQGIGDLYTNASTQAMINNAEWMIVLRQKDSEVQAAIDSKRLNIEEYGQNLLKTLLTSAGSYADLMIINNTEYGIYRLVIDSFAQTLYSTKQEERIAIIEAIDNGENVIDVINRFNIGKKSFDLVEEIKLLLNNAKSEAINAQALKQYLKELFDDKIL